MQFSIPVVSKARKPKFEVHLKIYDLNNVPLVSGVSLIKWGLPHSLHSEHRGRTHKCPIANHRVEYNYSKVIPVRISIDRNNNLTECPIEFEVLQEFNVPGPGGGTGGREEKITLGTVRLNLSEYVEESEAILREGVGAGNFWRTSFGASTSSEKSHSRKRSSLSGIGFGGLGADVSPRSSRNTDIDEPPSTSRGPDIEEGVVRRHLMQDSKINSTLKIGILMVQIDGDRNYAAPALKTAPVFGGIAGIIAGEPAVETSDEPTADFPGGTLPSSLTSKARDNAHEVQDMYRRALTASWACQPDELPADECIEDIFAGGDGFKTSTHHSSHGGVSHSGSRNHGHSSRHHLSPNGAGGSGPSSGSTSAGGDPHSAGGRDDSGSASGSEDMVGTLRPRDMARLRARLRSPSAGSDRSTTTVRDHTHESSRAIGIDRMRSHHDALLHAHQHQQQQRQHRAGHDSGKDSDLRSRSDSLGSLTTTTTVGSDRHERGREGFRTVSEVDESEVRDDLVAWSIHEPRAAPVR
ncbi:hypothetical protein GQ53DRAFT_844675 [Thozetella sp. PMI_491]|nr:hypothetical protein GQ53DRAFT_844675 [Thozetella sp. PMI_491]